MSRILFKLSLVYFLTLIICIKFGICSEVKSDVHYIDYEIQEFNNETEDEISLNTTDYNSYDEINDEEEDNNEKSFMGRVTLIHEEGKNVTISKYVKHINETFDLMENLTKVFKRLFPIDQRLGFELLEFLSDIDLGLSLECSRALIKIFISLRKSDLWAIKFVDSIGNFLPSGFAEGIQSSFGEYDECLEITSPRNYENSTIFRGQYCLLKLILPFPPVESYTKGEPLNHKSDLISDFKKDLNLRKFGTIKNLIEELNHSNGTIYRLGICIPSVCSAQEFENLLNKIFSPIIRLPLEVGPKCHIKDKTIELDNFELTSILIITILIILVITSTGFEIYKTQNESKSLEKILSKENKINDILISFSIIRNTRSLFAPNTRFTALDTIRLLLIINVHIAHTYSYLTSLGLASLKKIYSEIVPKIFEDNRYIFARNTLMIDALFTLSGFILSYGLLKKLDKTNGRFSYLGFLFQRWLRFSVLMFGSILFFYLFPLSGDGPIWDIGFKSVSQGCQNLSVLVQNFLFINNFGDQTLHSPHLKCNQNTWFLSTLLQLTIIAPTFILIQYKKPNLGIYAIIAAIITSLFASISPQLLFGIKPYLQIWELENTIFSDSESYKWYHMTPNNYGISFFVGIAFGYMLRKKILFTRSQEIYSWILSIVMIITVYFWHNSFWRLDKSAPLLNVLLWHSIGKLLFCLGFAWILYACCIGRGGFLNRFLSWHGFRPIARLSFGIYLLHHLVIIHRVFSAKNTFVMTDKLMFESIIIDLMIDTILAYVFYVLIESPFTNIFGVVFRNNYVKESKNFNNEKISSKL